MIGVVLGLLVAVSALAAYASARAVRCNVRELRRVRTAPPLEGLDLSAATVRKVEAPKTWPVIDDVTGPKVAAAYAALADDRAITCGLAGEVLLVAGGAAFGASLSLMDRGLVVVLWALLPPLAIVTVGYLLRFRATHRWEPVAARYQRRYRALTATALPPATPRRGLFGWWRRDAG